MTASNWTGEHSPFFLILLIAGTGRPGNAYSDALPHHYRPFFPIRLVSFSQSPV
jgi:hypothetical protein